MNSDAVINRVTLSAGQRTIFLYRENRTDCSYFIAFSELPLMLFQLNKQQSFFEDSKEAKEIVVYLGQKFSSSETYQRLLKNCPAEIDKPNQAICDSLDQQFDALTPFDQALFEPERVTVPIEKYNRPLSITVKALNV